MAIVGVAPGYQHPIGPINKGLDNKERIHSSGAGDTDDAQVGRLLEAANAGGIRSAVRTPVAQKSDDS